MKFTDVLFEESKDIWEGYLQHPFVQGIANGTLEQEKFKQYLIQDYLYLIQYTKVFCMGAVKSRTVAELNMFYNGADGILNDETATHIQYLKNYGISMDEIEAYTFHKTTDNYTSYMIGVSLTGSLQEIVAVLLPCIWSYHFIGKQISKFKHEHNTYQAWIDVYSSKEYGDFTEQWIEFTNELCEPLSDVEKQKLVQMFKKASVYEMDFWDMAEAGCIDYV